MPFFTVAEEGGLATSFQIEVRRRGITPGTWLQIGREGAYLVTKRVGDRELLIRQGTPPTEVQPLKATIINRQRVVC